MAISQSLYLRLVPACFTIILLYYSLIYILDPLSAVAIFEFDHTPVDKERYLFDALLALLGAKVSFVVFSLGTATLFASSRYLGVVMLAVSGMAFADGCIVRAYVGHGEWNHWGYGTIVACTGLLFIGVFDGKRGGEKRV